MAASTTALDLETGIEDVLAQLPISSITEYGKGQTIYGPTKPSKSIYLVLSGTVGISQTAEDGSEVLLEIVRPDELFGESAFLGIPRSTERSVAIEAVKLMAWAVSDMEALITKRPRLAVAMLQIFAQRNAEFTRRIASFSIDNIERRLARSLILFSERMGSMEEDGSVRMMAFTHEMLSQYVGTSREVVTQHMNRFRKQGHVSYSRNGILVYRDSFEMMLGKGREPVAAARSCGA